ncbi:unnamed protein product [Ilex paraguariensis]|uniref:Uncharacterized protein n=1 Tax=Ilex paraguariensis TaxID=185542 RepID=A0ABC8RSL9_9AQUA
MQQRSAAISIFGTDRKADGDPELPEVGNEVGGGGGGGVAQYWPWAAASAAQLAWGISAFRRGYAGDSRLMPLKAFAVASLFLGASSTAAFGTLRASGIHSVCYLSLTLFKFLICT